MRWKCVVENVGNDLEGNKEEIAPIAKFKGCKAKVTEGKQ